MSGKWKLTWGIHRGTLMSRDTGNPKECDSLEDCKAEANRLAASFEEQGFGYRMWFATAHGPDGQIENFEEHQHYYAR